ncbi:MSMEG_1061 family FMN-dependent PPOX-type flavoprotein [uncultured Pelagimonas sp.]|uniref:MSMEG_1061 family FMN-dependent PPOX-type flavoprotein n=1 Tax=uncultured Pelagimonas sp. TaxID=1618102 RepID=UPI00262D4BB8|nr:MSMEG_1061 family FMN-dependent PPOX-type flavoprotein [uncultured Pelagimonas sp.]
MAVFEQNVDLHIQSSTQLRQIVEMPSLVTNNKVIDHIDPLAGRFIAASPLMILSTKRADGGLDQTPRGDPSGFVKVVDRNTLALPDRPGNNRMDAIENILATGEVGLLFLIPGHGDTLRISGKAAVVQDAQLSEDLAVNGRPSGLVVLIRVERVLSHCPKAFIRSKAWQPDDWPDTSDVPSLAEMLQVHGALADSLADLDALIETSNTNELY